MAVQFFSILLAAGLILVAAEVFVPGGVLGVLGALCLAGAIATSFAAFGPEIGAVVTMSILLLGGLFLFLWIKYFPRTSIGRAMTVSRDLKTSDASEPGIHELINKEGVTLSALRPAGYARIEGRRVDVVTEGGMIDKGESIVVVDVESNRVVVRRAASKQSAVTK